MTPHANSPLRVRLQFSVLQEYLGSLFCCIRSCIRRSVLGGVQRHVRCAQKRTLTPKLFAYFELFCGFCLFAACLSLRLTDEWGPPLVRALVLPHNAPLEMQLYRTLESCYLCTRKRPRPELTLGAVFWNGGFSFRVAQTVLARVCFRSNQGL